jgi:imidazolonepropionase-like amidohydrolase
MSLVFVDGRVVVGDGRVLEHASVLVEGDRITRVVEKGFAPTGDHRRIPLEGGTLLPGFIDAHVHVCLDAGPDPMSSFLKTPTVLSAFKAADVARRTLMAGVTSIRDMGGRDGIDLGLRQAIRTGLVHGPRMLVSGAPICMTGGHGWQIGCEADGPDGVRRAARTQIKAGVDIVKLMATGGVLTPGVEPGSEQLTEEELRAGVEEAHKAGKRTATHAMGARGILNALHAGIDSIEHGIFLNDEAIEWMRRHGVPYIPTLSAPIHIERQGVAAGIPAFAVEKALMVKPHHLASIRLARQAGVTIAMGTDAGTPFNRHGENLGELQLLVDLCGFSPLEAIEAGTRISAGVLGLENELGTIAEGKLADLVVVNGNPLDDIGALLGPSAVRMVIQSGRIVKETHP